MSSYANDFDKAVAGRYEAREADWRNGAISYSVLVDRFAPTADIDSKRHLYPAPKTLHAWSETPERGVYLEDERLWSHEIAFWGGDLPSLRSNLQYIADLGVEVLYLNPIVASYTNHKYDALDFAEIAPEFGTRQDVKDLAAELHRRGMKLVLDGVFNHMGRNSEFFKDAQANPESPYRDWFYFGDAYPGGARSWNLAENLPELNWENPAVQDYLYAKKDSIVRQYLRDGADGWRLDVAFDIGMKFLKQLTKAAHKEKQGSLVLGEIAQYPKEWFPSVDGMLLFGVRDILLNMVNGKVSPTHTQRLIDRVYSDCDFEHMLKCWIYLDNHDTPRLATTVEDWKARQIALVLLMTLPGAPNLYYGSELGMEGDDDPYMRAPMQWDWVNDENTTLSFTKQMIDLHNKYRALKVGDYRTLTCEKLFGFERYTDKVADTIVVLANPTDQPVTDAVQIANSKIMNQMMFDLVGENHQSVRHGMLYLTLPPQTIVVLTPEMAPAGGYTAYKRVQ